MTARRRTMVAALVALGLLVTGVACDQGDDGDLHESTCTVATREDARCGTLVVPENRITGEGRTIPVNFVVVPATGAHPAKDPWLFLAGGPGDAATDAAAGFVGLVGVNARHDLVFIDQRGTGRSNPLTCPVFPDLPDRAGVRRSVESCLASLPGDLRFYTTAMYADDVDQVLGALGYGAANLLGVSYGTIAAQVLLERHPDRVRSMMLLSGSPLTVPIYERMSGSAQAALDNVFARCAREQTCRAAFPDLRGDWHRLWSSLSRGPWVVSADRSPTGKELRLDAATLAAALNRLMRNADTAADIPVLVHELGATSDHATALKRVGSAVTAAGGALDDDGGRQLMINYPFMCNEPWASFPPTALASQRNSFEYRIDLAQARRWRYVCGLIPPSPRAAVGGEGSPASDVPVLTLNGEADPIDPPSIMAAASRLWPNSRRLVGPGQGHDILQVTWTLCLSDLTRRFVDRGSVQGLDTSCIDRVAAPMFVLDIGSLRTP